VSRTSLHGNRVALSVRWHASKALLPPVFQNQRNACAKLARASSLVRPYPFAPGISGQYAMTQSPSRSKTAVNSLRISDLGSSLPSSVAGCLTAL